MSSQAPIAKCHQVRIKTAQDAGFKVTLKQENGFSYFQRAIKGDLHIWAFGKSHPWLGEYWQTAKLINGQYQDHKQYETVHDAVKRK